ncbi:CPBP family intramembrane metalloprotease [Lactobacillus mellis]|uniref:CPBP family intramembrane glutamic endopeptidase n=1 Tax=Bombilactobacillus mellis TaxID=1218508 RepID=UPI00157FDA24|nr:CPBP family intramembrane glutamic endopeptidase [Bombilactobacillus mellis]NUG67321.1 CPBP family intramembrane metalloprotease [Bombilactobacillus mellis]
MAYKLQHNSHIRYWFLGQYFGELIILTCIMLRRILGTAIQNQPLGLVLLLSIVAFIIILPGIFLIDSPEAHLSKLKNWQRYARLFNHYLQSLSQALILPGIFMVLSSMLQSKVSFWNNTIFIIIMLYSLIMYIPVGILALSRIQAVSGRLLTTMFMALIILGTPLTNNHNLNKILLDFIHSGFLAAMSFMVLTLIVMQIWNFPLPKLAWPTQGSPKVLTFLVTLCLVFIFFNTFSTATNWQQILTHFDFHISALSLNFILSGLEAGLLEEWLCRFIFLYLLLRALQHRSWQLDTAVIGSSFIFSLIHLTNLIAQNWVTTLNQAAFAFSIGIFLATLYLYTKAFWWPVLFHISLDLLSFITSGHTTMAAPSQFKWQFSLLIMAIFLVTALFLLSGSHREIMHKNVSELL